MKKSLIKFCLLLSFSTSVLAQKESIPPPPDAEALAVFKTNAELHKLIKERTGYNFSQIKMVKTYSWEKYYSSEGELRKNKWTKDLITKAFDIETPKDKEGIYNVYQVFIDYRRSVCNMNGCLMTDKYTYYKYGVGPAYTYGFKKFNKDEKLSLVVNYLKKNKPKCLDDIITISNIEVDENYEDNNIDSKQQIIYLRISGKLGIYSTDYSRMYSIEEFKNQTLYLYVSNKSNKWQADSVSFEDKVYNEYMYRGNKELLKEYYSPYKNVGFEAVFQKTNKIDPPTGMYEKINERVNDFMKVIISKAENITIDDVWPFVAPYAIRGNYTDEEMKSKINQRLKISQTSSYIKLFTDYKINQYYFSYEDYKDDKGNNLPLQDVKTFGKGTVEKYKFSKGTAKKGKSLEPKKEDDFEFKWVYDIKTQNWYIIEFQIPYYN